MRSDENAERESRRRHRGQPRHRPGARPWPARDGYRVVVAAKSVESTEKLPGSIHTVAREVERWAAKRVPLQVDVRDERQIEEMAARSVERFGRIDVLVNNAGALHWQSLLETPAKKFDLVLSVNARAAFLCCLAVLPTMIRQKQGHIINMSPPLDLAMVPGRIAYAISKLGMTMLTHGLAEEIRPHNIAVNSLWPVTIIESQASINWSLGARNVAWKARHPCGLRATTGAQHPGEMTGHALLDEDFLRRALRTSAATLAFRGRTRHGCHGRPSDMICVQRRWGSRRRGGAIARKTACADAVVAPVWYANCIPVDRQRGAA